MLLAMMGKSPSHLRGWKTRRRNIAAVAAHAKMLSVARAIRAGCGLADHPALAGH